MNRPARSIEIFSMSALDLFITAMGSFAILMMILFPYYKADRKEQAKKKAERQGNVLFCTIPTRMKDYEQFYNETAALKDPQRDTKRIEEIWKSPGIEMQPDYPVVGVKWEQAQEFCRWLTKKERASGAIQPEDEYRLPTSAEWSAACGPDKFPWGDQWPPPPKAANIAGAEYREAIGNITKSHFMGDYRDDHEMFSPVGSYTPTRDGVYDLVGNVWQMCQDTVPDSGPATKTGEPKKMRFIFRGSGWMANSAEVCRSAASGSTAFDQYSTDIGFRCVLVINSPPKP
jgi:formylglycine-generating enzyme required for sulfatase activity